MTLNLLNYCSRSLCRASFAATHIRNVSYGQREVIGPASSKFPGYNVVFEYKYYKKASMGNRLKLYQSILGPLYVVTHISIDYYFDLEAEVTPFLMPFLTFHLGITYLIMAQYNDLIIYMYSNEKDGNIIITYNSMWGKRKNITVKPEDIEILSEPKGRYRATHLMIHPTRLTLKLPTKCSIVHNPRKFASLFGEKILLRYPV